MRSISPNRDKRLALRSCWAAEDELSPFQRKTSVVHTQIIPPPKKNLSEKWFNIVAKSCTFCKYPGFVCSFIYCVLSFLLVWRLSLCIKNIYLLLGLWSVVKHLPSMGNAMGLVLNTTTTTKKIYLFYIPYLISNFIPLICIMLTVIPIWWKYWKENQKSKFQSV